MITRPAAPRSGGAAALHRRDLIALLLLAGLAAAFCLYRLGARSIWLDEAVALRIAAERFAALVSDGGNMAAYYLFLKGWLQLGQSEWIARLPSAIFSAAAVAFLYLLALRLFSGRAAFIAALLLALNSSVVRYGQEARGYALELMLVTSAWLVLSVALGRRRMRWFLLWGLLSALAVATHVLAIFVLAAQLASLLLLPPRNLERRGILAGVGVALAGAAPILVVAARAGTTQIDWIPPASLQAFRQVLLFLAGYNFEPSPHLVLRLLNFVVLAACVAGWTAGGWIWWRTLRRTGRSPEVWAHGLPVAWLFVPLLAATVVSVAFHSLLAPRYFIALVPASCLLVAVAVSRLPRALAPAAVALLVAFGVAGVVRSYGTGNWGWREAATHLLSSARPGDGVVVLPAYQRLPLDYYVEHTRNQFSFDYLSPKQQAWMPPKGSTFRVVEAFYAPSSPAQAAAAAGKTARFWLVSSDFTRWDGSGQVVESWADAGAFFRALGPEFRVRSGSAFDRVGVLLLERVGPSASGPRPQVNFRQP
ncbi:MAG: glycosyltransferase family 39 protein [Actinomycetota bacterium]|nr:glycosyltransferase family 39 protein [Actinomycetota bacterium]